jgi:hypothetical protein
MAETAAEQAERAERNASVVSSSTDSSMSSTQPPEERDMVDDEEAQKHHKQKQAAHWELVFDQTHCTPEVINWRYKGSGTEEDPYVVVYIDNDRRNPMGFPDWKKWVITLLVAFVSLSKHNEALPPIRSEDPSLTRSGNPSSILRLFSILRRYQQGD